MALLALHCDEESLCRSCVLKVASRSSLGMLRYVLVGSCAAAAAGSDPVQLVCPRYSGIRLYYNHVYTYMRAYATRAQHLTALSQTPF